MQMTHPSLGGSTSADAALLQTQLPRWVCAGRCLRRASRNNCSPACTCGRSATPYSQPAETAKTRMFICFCLFLTFYIKKIPIKTIQFEHPRHRLSGSWKRSKQIFLCSWHKIISQYYPFQTGRMFIHLPPLEVSWDGDDDFGVLFNCVCLTLHEKVFFKKKPCSVSAY